MFAALIGINNSGVTANAANAESPQNNHLPEHSA